MATWDRPGTGAGESALGRDRWRPGSGPHACWAFITWMEHCSFTPRGAGALSPGEETGLRGSEAGVGLEPGPLASCPGLCLSAAFS